MTQFEVYLHWFYVIVMFASAASFVALSRSPKGVPVYKYLIHTFVTVWSGLAYASIALGQGSVDINGETVHYARYLDWVVTTPLLLLSLNLTGKFNIPVEGTVTSALLGSQVIMILTGMIAELSDENRKWFWYIAGCIALLIVLYLMWVPLQAKANQQGPEIAGVYRSSALFLTIQWLAYPLVWLIGKMGLDLLDATTTTILFIILPIISKAGFGFFNLTKLRALPEQTKAAA